MNKLFVILLAAVLTLGSMEAEARRMGGGKSFGRQSGNVTQREAARTPPNTPPQSAPNQGAQQPRQQANQPAAAGAAAQTARRPWGAMLGGLAAGLGLAWLANAMGFGEGFANLMLILLLGVVLMAVIGWLRRRSAGASAAAAPAGLAYQGAGSGPVPAPSQVLTPRQYNPEKVGNDASARPWENGRIATDAGAAAGGSMIGSALAGSQTWGIPSGFDADGFVSAAKRNFLTLQQAWDRADVKTLRSMMTDGMVSEIQTQLAEREQASGGQPNQTEVLKLDAQLLGIEELDDEYLASVEFNGLVREDPGAAPSAFREVWNMTKPKNGGSGWLVAGVQALQ